MSNSESKPRSMIHDEASASLPGLDALRVVSINHKTAPLEVLEGVALSPEDVGALLAGLGRAGIEAVGLATCNRNELYWIARSPADDMIVEHALFRTWRRPPAELHASALRLEGTEAARHLFRVAAGLESLMVGESEILGQARAALELAGSAAAPGPVLIETFRAALRFGGRARSCTRIGAGAVSVASASIQSLRRACSDLSQLEVVVLGAGHTGMKAARHLKSEKVGRVVMVNRTPERAKEVAVRLGAEAATLAELPALVADADALIVAIQVPTPLVTPALMAQALAGRTKPLVVVDLSMPRAVSPEVASLPGVTLVDLSRLEDAVELTRKLREREIPLVETLLEAELERFEEEAHEHAARPLVAELRVRAEAIRKAEVERAVAAGDIDAEMLDRVTRRLVDRLLRAPSAALRQGARPRAGGAGPLECVLGEGE